MKPKSNPNPQHTHASSKQMQKLAKSAPDKMSAQLSTGHMGQMQDTANCKGKSGY